MANISKDNGTAIKSTVKAATKKPTPIKPAAPTAPKLPTLNGIRPEILVTIEGVTYSAEDVAVIIEALKAEQTRADNAVKAAAIARKQREEARTKRQLAEIKAKRDAAAKDAMAAIEAEYRASLQKLGVKVASPKGKKLTDATPANVASMTPAAATALAKTAGIAVANIAATEEAEKTA